MSASLALYHAVKRFRHEKLGMGIEAVAKLLDYRNSDVLQKKLNPTCDSHHITLDEAEAITEAIKDPSAAVEFARLAGLVCLPMPRVEDGSLHKGMADIGREFSELVAEFAEGTADNVISPNDCDRFQKEMTDLFVACNAELGRMRAMAATRAPVIPIGGRSA